MNYSFIKFAQKQLIKLKDDCLKWKEKVSLNLFTLTKANPSEQQRKKMYSSLLEHTNFLSEEVRKILEGLEVVRFSENQAFLGEEKKQLIQECKKIIDDLREIKEVISQQTDRKTTIITPLQRKIAKRNYCYFCDVSIVGDFSYKLKEEEQQAYGVEIPEGAAFCSQKCLWNHCDEYEKREQLRQEEKEKIREKVEKDRKAINEIQGQITDFTERINRLKRKEKELELFPESNHAENPEKVGFFRRLGRRLGLVKKPHPLSKLERVRKVKEGLYIQLENAEKRLKRSLITLSLDEQKQKERKKLEERILLEKEKHTADKMVVGEEEETFDD